LFYTRQSPGSNKFTPASDPRLPKQKPPRTSGGFGDHEKRSHSFTASAGGDFSFLPSFGKNSSHFSHTTSDRSLPNPDSPHSSRRYKPRAGNSAVEDIRQQ
jgi:hypothetical protein